MATQPPPLTVRLPDELVEQIAHRVAELLNEQLQALSTAGSPWLDFEAALAYLGFSRDKLYKLTAARAIPFHKKIGGQGLLFHRNELDQWVALGYSREGPQA
jgi:excisionase family DNA binding protein